DSLVGLAMLGAATFVFAYYTTWTFILPFVSETHFLNLFFLPREWAIRIPVFLLLVATLGVGTFIGKTVIKSAQKEKAKK
ncbi:hypothetical protein BABINDRAFT_22307, partial [Babjeviella inositovora NRRL Y-12698]